MTLVLKRGVGPDEQSFRVAKQVIHGEVVVIGLLGANGRIDAWWTMKPKRFASR